ncbi:uncharacterized protein UHOD_01656 [Ustilago sp. UG-2017b]|nr:uncharacterized protein UHOD_01656 [Ustilago sp. UG-2017b]
MGGQYQRLLLPPPRLPSPNDVGRIVPRATPAFKLARKVRMIQTIHPLCSPPAPAPPSTALLVWEVEGRGNFVLHKRTKVRSIRGESWDSRMALLGSKGSVNSFLSTTCFLWLCAGVEMVFAGVDDASAFFSVILCRTDERCCRKSVRTATQLETPTHKCKARPSTKVTASTFKYETSVGSISP